MAREHNVDPNHRDRKIHYGKRFAETEEWMAARMMNHQLEELAGVAPESPTSAPPTQEGTAPIGALPVSGAPASPPPAEAGANPTHAVEHLKRVGLAVVELCSASVQLALWPARTALRWAAKGLRLRPD